MSQKINSRVFMQLDAPQWHLLHKNKLVCWSFFALLICPYLSFCLSCKWVWLDLLGILNKPCLFNSNWFYSRNHTIPFADILWLITFPRFYQIVLIVISSCSIACLFIHLHTILSSTSWHVKQKLSRCQKKLSWKSLDCLEHSTNFSH